MRIYEGFIGRERELNQLDRFVGPGRDGLRLAMLSGPSGLGKTSLAAVATERAAQRGFRVATVRGRAGSLSAPFAPFMEAMPEFEALLSVLAADGVVDPEHAGTGLVALLAELTTETPLLLAFDDAQALDESSIALLPYLTGVSERMDLTVLFIEQTDAIGVPSSYRSFIDGLLARRVVGHLRLGPMDDACISELVRAVLGIDADADVPSDIVLRAEGNPWFAKELAEAFSRGATEVPGTIAAAATARLHALGEDAQDVVSAVALCPEGAHISWLEGLAGIKPRQFVRLMETIQASGLVREDGDVIAIAHPLMQQALVDELSAAMRRAVHIELADVIGTLPLPEVQSSRARGHHLARAGRIDDAVVEYLQAAEANEVAGQLHESYADLGRALEAETRAEQRIAVLQRCAQMAMQLGLARALEHWMELGRTAAARGDDELYAFALLQQYWTSNDGTLNDRLQRAAQLGPETVGWSARAAATIARMDGSFDTAITLDERAIEIGERRGDSVLAAVACRSRASSLADLGRLDDAIDAYRAAVDQLIRLRYHDWSLIARGELVETLLDDLRTEEALREIDAAVRYADDLGLERMRHVLLAWRASALLCAGDVEAAVACADEAHATLGRYGSDPANGSDPGAALVHLVRAEAGNDAGRVDAADIARAAVEQVDLLGFNSWSEQARFEHMRSNARSGGVGAVLAEARAILATDEPKLAAAAASWLARASAHEGCAEGLRMAAELLVVPVDNPSPHVQLVRDEIATIADIVLEDGDVMGMQAIVERWADAGRVLEALRVQGVFGALLVARGKADIARPLLTAAKQALARCGASADGDQIAGVLRATGARSRARSRETGVGNLTRRELEIARLVARGLRNADVAQMLFLAEKTVAAHLSNIYGKLEVRSRVQLTSWLRDNDPALADEMAAVETA